MASVPQPVPISSTRRVLADLGHVEDRVDLAQLGLLEGLRAQRLVLVEDRRAVAHRLVEEGREEVVGQVVVRLDVAARAEQRVVLDARDAAVDEAAQPQPALGTAVVMRSAKGMSSSARSVPSAAFQSPAM